LPCNVEAYEITSLFVLSVYYPAHPEHLKGGIVELEDTVVARQLPGKHIPRSNRYAGNKRRTFGRGVSYAIPVLQTGTQYVSERKVGAYFFPELLVCDALRNPVHRVLSGPDP
jgi:hypothetical protein